MGRHIYHGIRSKGLNDFAMSGVFGRAIDHIRLHPVDNYRSLLTIR